MEGGTVMRHANDPLTGIEDLLFDEDGGRPSER